jgi:hypothetical protein
VAASLAIAALLRQEIGIAMHHVELLHTFRVAEQHEVGTATTFKVAT